LVFFFFLQDMPPKIALFTPAASFDACRRTFLQPPCAKPVPLTQAPSWSASVSRAQQAQCARADLCALHCPGAKSKRKRVRKSWAMHAGHLREPPSSRKGFPACVLTGPGPILNAVSLVLSPNTASFEWYCLPLCDFYLKLSRKP
jgi:hypothetical protein